MSHRSQSKCFAIYRKLVQKHLVCEMNSASKLFVAKWYCFCQMMPGRPKYITALEYLFMYVFNLKLR